MATIKTNALQKEEGENLDTTEGYCWVTDIQEFWQELKHISVEGIWTYNI